MKYKSEKTLANRLIDKADEISRHKGALNAQSDLFLSNLNPNMQTWYAAQEEAILQHNSRALKTTNKRFKTLILEEYNAQFTLPNNLLENFVSQELDKFSNASEESLACKEKADLWKNHRGKVYLASLHGVLTIASLVTVATFGIAALVSNPVGIALLAVAALLAAVDVLIAFAAMCLVIANEGSLEKGMLGGVLVGLGAMLLSTLSAPILYAVSSLKQSKQQESTAYRGSFFKAAESPSPNNSQDDTDNNLNEPGLVIDGGLR